MFYKLDGELISSTFVSGPNYDLVSDNHNDYTYPIDGWHWFDTIEAAHDFFGVDININVNPERN